MGAIRLFVSSTSELASDRSELEVLISRETEVLIKKGLFLELIVWEDFVESMSQARLEEAYNDMIAQSDIFVMLLSKHAGKYVLEEFEQALAAQLSTGKPFIFTYLKDTAVDATNTDSTALGDFASFRERLDRLGHFYVFYRDSNALKQHFSAQLSKLLVTFIARDTPSETAITRPKKKVFVSYSHNDSEYLDRLLVHLAPLREEKLIDLWVDTTL